MVGRTVVVAGAGASGGNLVTTVAQYTSPTQVILAANAASTVSGATFTINGLNGVTITNGNYYVADSTPSTGLVVVGKMYAQPARNFYPARADGNVYQDGFSIEESVRGRVSGDKGDNDYTWDPLGVAATGTLSLSVGTNVLDGDSVTIGSAPTGAQVKYTFRTTPAAMNDVKIGATFGATLTSLANAINGAGTPGSDYSPGTAALAHASAVVTGSGATATLTVTAVPGPQGNALVTTKISTTPATSTLAWTAATLTGGLPPENIICFETPLTQNRTLTLPAVAVTQSNLFNGAWLQVVRSVASANDLIIKTGATELARIRGQQTGSIKLAYRRAKWVIVSDTTGTMQVPSSLLGDQAGTADLTGRMVGLGVVGSTYTPVKSGQILVTICGDIFNPTAIGDGAKARLRWGTGAAPANGAALVGTIFTNIVKYVAPTTATRAPFSLTGVITGAAVGTPLWVDVDLAAITGGTATIENCTFSAVEIT
jgi:hypothetical protein